MSKLISDLFLRNACNVQGKNICVHYYCMDKYAAKQSEVEKIGVKQNYLYLKLQNIE
jgi:hypothetical protein